LEQYGWINGGMDIPDIPHPTEDENNNKFNIDFEVFFNGVPKPYRTPPG